MYNSTLNKNLYLEKEVTFLWLDDFKKKTLQITHLWASLIQKTVSIAR